jgi:hypothetical protein
MNSSGDPMQPGSHPVDLRVNPAVEGRNRLTTAFRLILAIPHLLLVGGPAAAGFSWATASEDGGRGQSGGSGGVLGLVAAVASLIAWFAILFTGRHPDGLWKLSAFYLRWRTRALAYTVLLRDEYPPFGDGLYPLELELEPPATPRNRLTVAFRLLLAIPHVLAVMILGLAWLLTSIVGWFSILATGEYPPSLYRFSAGVLQWNLRVEAYLLLLRDEYPPFSLE